MIRKVEIVLVSKEQICEDNDMYRITCENQNSGWGCTLQEAIQNFDKNNQYKRINDSLKGMLERN